MAEQLMQNKAGEMAAKQIIPAGYKLTEIGVIPSDWKVINGRELFVKIQDGTHFSPKVNGGEFLYITSKNIRNGFLDLKSADYIDKCQHEKIYRRCDVTINDILITKDGANTGNVCLNPLGEPFSLLSSVAFLRLNKKHHEPKFFVQQILSATFQSTIKDEMSGNAITRLTLGKINGLKFYVPELNEQKAIAGVLSDTDELIAGLEQLIAKKQAIKTATMQQLLTGRTRLPPFYKRSDGTPKGYKQSELGQIPEDWETSLLGGVADKIMVGIASAATHAYCKSGIPMLRNQNIKPNRLDSNDLLFINKEYEMAFKNKRLKAGDLLTARTGYPGTTCIIPDDFENAQSFTTLITRPTNKVNSKFLAIFMNSEIGVDFFDKNQIGGGQKNINASTLRKFIVAAPKLEEQTAIATIISDMDMEIVALEEKLAKTRDLKQGMMQQLLTGRIRLPLSKEA